MKRFYQPVAWGLVFTLALLASAGEFLHFLPGCSHYVRLPDGSLALMGRTDAKTGYPASPPGQGQNISKGHPQSLLILDADECAICAFTALEKQASQLVSITADSLPICLLAVSHEKSFSCFFSQTPPVRGPPAIV